MKIGDLDTGQELTPEGLTEWLIERTRFLMNREIPEREPDEFLKELKQYSEKRNDYTTAEQKLIGELRKEVEELRRQLHNTFRMLDTAEERLGETIQGNNELRKRLREASGDLGQ